MSLTRSIAIAGFLVAIVACAVVEVLARRRDSTIPTLGEVCAHAIAYEVGRVPVGRIGFFGFWWWLGWHLFAR